MKENIQWIFFDIGSTLADESKAYQKRIEEAVAGSDITYQQFYDTMIEYYCENLRADLEPFKYFGLAKPAWHSEYEKLYPETKACLKRLKLKFKIGIIANQIIGLKERLKRFGISEYVDLVISSAEEGVAKPDLRIFEIAAERAGCAFQNAVMVGDRLDNDIAPANMLGMKTIWIKQGFCKYSSVRNELERPDYTVNDLNEVCDLLLGK